MATSTNGRRITTHEATVKTAAVEVKTLTISGKQVTLAVFRQLQKGALVLWPELTFNGIPWGTVNYHADCYDDTYHEGCNLKPYTHLHVVWQAGHELRQDIIPGRPECAPDTTGPHEERAAFMQRWTRMYDTLQQLDQLFIAV